MTSFTAIKLIKLIKLHTGGPITAELFEMVEQEIPK